MKKISKVQLIIVWCIQFFIAYILFIAAYAKFSAAPDAVAVFEKIGIEPNGRILIGVLELLCVLLLVIPHSSVYGAFLGLGIMTGAILGHLTDIGIEGLHMALVVFVGCFIIIYLRRHESSIFRNMFN